jgi:(1->4)-alpha-D-glucan 1-alpha-D-glucosylmutase
VTPERLAEWCARPEDDGLKLYLTARLLHVRREYGGVLSHGIYEPLAARGEHGEQVVSYRRSHGGASFIVIVPRLTCRVGGNEVPMGQVWGETRVMLPADERARQWRCVLSGQRVEVMSDGEIRVGDALARLPVALLACEASS